MTAYYVVLLRGQNVARGASAPSCRPWLGNLEHRKTNKKKSYMKDSIEMDRVRFHGCLRGWLQVADRDGDPQFILFPWIPTTMSTPRFYSLPKKTSDLIWRPKIPHDPSCMDDPVSQRVSLDRNCDRLICRIYTAELGKCFIFRAWN